MIQKSTLNKKVYTNRFYSFPCPHPQLFYFMGNNFYLFLFVYSSSVSLCKYNQIGIYFLFSFFVTQNIGCLALFYMHFISSIYVHLKSACLRNSTVPLLIPGCSPHNIWNGSESYLVYPILKQTSLLCYPGDILVEYWRILFHQNRRMQIKELKWGSDSKETNLESLIWILISRDYCRE